MMQRKLTKKYKQDRLAASTFDNGNKTNKNKEPKKEEEEFLRAVEVGDLPSVRKLLASHKNLNVNCTDILGRTPMRLAVENEHQDIVELLLDKSHPRHLYESLLLAISLDHDDIAETILKHPVYEKLERQSSYTGHSGQNFYQTLISEDSQFSAETTPLILAAQRNRFQIVSLLIKKGQRIEKPHKHNCKCAHCKAQVALDELRYAKSRLNAYKGLASDAYIAISSDDPVLTAFELGQELRQVAAKEKHYRAEYESLAQKMSDFVVKLLDQVRGNEELDLILNEQLTEGHMDCHGKLARLKLAIKLNEKQFVAHPSCQKKLTSIWYHDVQFHRLPLALRPGFVVLLTALFPVLAVIYWLFPNSKVGTFLRTPFIKFVGQSMSFFIFLTLIVTFSFTEKPSSGTLENAKSHFFLQQFHRHFNDTRHNLTGIYRQLSVLQLRQFRPGIFQVLICLWIIGLLWQELKQLYYEGFDGYISSLFNMIDFFSLKMYIASFTLRYLSYFKTQEALLYFTEKDSWDKLVLNRYEALYQAYWLIADRYFWDDWDPTYICEGIFAVANVLSFSRLFYLLAANEQLGPLQVSLRRMIVDIMKFFMIFSIVFSAFLVGLNNLYWYYEPTVREVVEEHSQHTVNLMTRAEKAFGTIELTFRTVYWALFGMGDKQVVEVGANYSKAFTERIGYIVYGAYNMCAAVVLLNMLIAMMSRSFDIIQNEEHVEWKFARAQLYMDYIQEGSTLPPPLNIVPSPKSLFRIFCPLVNCCKRTCGKNKGGRHGRGSSRSKGNYDRRTAGAGHGATSATGHTYTKQQQQRLATYQERDNNSRSFKTNNSGGGGGGGTSKRLHHQIYDICEEEEHMELDGMTSSSSTGGGTSTSRGSRHGGGGRRSARGVNGGGDESMEPLTNDLESVTQTPEHKRERLTFQAVMKSVVKRYIFESQKDESSPLEGEIEELKQDLSSFRYEMLNHLTTQQNSLQETLLTVNQKLDHLMGVYHVGGASGGGVGPSGAGDPSGNGAGATASAYHHAPLTSSMSVPADSHHSHFPLPSLRRDRSPRRERQHLHFGSGSKLNSADPDPGQPAHHHEQQPCNLFSPHQPMLSEGSSPVRDPPPYSSTSHFSSRPLGANDGTSPPHSHGPTTQPELPLTTAAALSSSAGNLNATGGDAFKTPLTAASDVDTWQASLGETSLANPTPNLNPAPTTTSVPSHRALRSTSLTGDVPVLRRDKLHAQSERAGVRKRQPFEMDVTPLQAPQPGTATAVTSPPQAAGGDQTSRVSPQEDNGAKSPPEYKQKDMENFIKLWEKNMPRK